MESWLGYQFDVVTTSYAVQSYFKHFARICFGRLGIFEARVPQEVLELSVPWARNATAGDH